jgi:probable rRNA maturation factor
MSSELVVRNCQRALRVELHLLRRVSQCLLEKELGLADYSLGIQFVSERRMAEINAQFLKHEGPTDVITFEYQEPGGREPNRRNVPEMQTRGSSASDASALHGELFICPRVAKVQARQYRTSMTKELARYIIHGVLHLRGFDDQSPRARRIMKHEESRLLRRLSGNFRLTRPPNSS